MRQWVGSILFTVGMFASVPFYGVVAILVAPLPRGACYAVARAWCRSMLALLKWLCGLDYVVEGREHLPDGPSVVLMKHSSAWETIAQLDFLPPQTWVAKRELTKIPFFGWVLVRLGVIAIDRGAGRTAVEQVIAEGCRRIDAGLTVVIFPEGTRVPAGQHKKYGLSGALLAAAAGCPVVPIAHNAGEFWPRRGWLKRQGTIRVSIGAPVRTRGREPREINDEVRAFIDARLAELGGAASGAAAAGS
jgi:1-acyl-sn-glycerol-3-phosphate acyltransferase